MKKKSLNLDQLKDRSFVTTLNEPLANTAKGGGHTQEVDPELTSCVLPEVIIISVNTKKR